MKWAEFTEEEHKLKLWGFILIIITKQFALFATEINRRKKLEFVFINILILTQKEKFVEKEDQYVKRYLN